MTSTFYVLALVMSVCALLLIVLLPRFWRRETEGESTVDWLILRREELAEEDPNLITDAELRAVDELDEEDAGSSVAPASLGKAGVGVALAVLLLPLLLYGQLGSLEDVRLTTALSQVEASGDAETVRSLIAAIQQRSNQRPDNPDYLSLLGQYYTGAEEYGRALEAYEGLLRLFPESPDVLAQASQAEYLAGGRTLTSQARLRAEMALAADPDQRTALGTLGMSAFEAGDYTAALGHWERLLVMETPGTPGYQMMAEVIAEARRRGGIDAPDAPTEAAASGKSLAIVITPPEGASIPEGTTVFVLARPSGAQSRMPTAVRRVRTGQWPLSLTLDDSHAMAGQVLSALESVQVEVQVSPSGQPGRSNAAWVAEADNVILSEPANLELQLRPTGP